MVATLKDRPSRVQVPPVGFAGGLDDDFLSSIEVSPQGGDPAVARRRRAEVLVAFAGGRREPVEELRLRFLRRLHRASDDFGATEGLRVVEAALALIPYPEELAAEPLRAERSRRRWWRRRGTL
ncbi:MAG: hypothetical protein ACRD07_15730 [Acidimicrobiales bacterium]